MRFLFALAAGAACLAASPSVLAAPANPNGPIYGATFSGTASGADPLKLFGSSGNVDGSAFSEIFFINSGLIARDGVEGPNMPGFSDRTTGSDGADDGNGNFINGQLTINGQTVYLYSTYFGEAYVTTVKGDPAPYGASDSSLDNASDYKSGAHTAQVYDDVSNDDFELKGSMYYATLATQVQTNGSIAGFPDELNQSFSVPVGQNGVTGSGDLLIYNAADDTLYEDISLDPTVAAAPEPGTWALMMLGVGICGWMLGYRKRVHNDHQAKLALIP